ncbi:MAG: hypothetical protein LUG60_03950 [Erysipelotrichaceae bacterium]|nr:hypothetical protein [Erysipelotrichaceae bacterium]
MKDKEPMKFLDAYHFEHTFSGFVWILIGILEFLPGSEFIDMIITILAIIGIICLSVTHFRKREMEDEMATQHINEANTMTLSIVVLLLCMFAVALQWFENTIEATTIIPIILGTIEFFQGVFFWCFEKYGE